MCHIARCLAVMLSLALAVAAVARPADPATVREVFREVKLEANMAQIGGQMRSMFKAQMDRMIAAEPQLANDAEVKALLEEFGDKVMMIAMSQLESPAMWDGMVAAYSKVYSEEELQALLKFYRSPVGRKMVEKTPELMQHMMLMVQQRMPAIEAEMKRVGLDLEAALHELRKKRELEAAQKP